MKASRNLAVMISVLLVALTALAAAWFTLRAGDDRGRPERPLDVAVVRAPPLNENTAVVGGPPTPTPGAPASRNSRP